MTRLYGLFGFALLFVAWTGLSLISPELFPDAVLVGSRLFEMVAGGRLLFDIWSTLYATIVSFGLAMLIGFGVGSLIGVNPLARDLFRGPLDFLRSIPAFILLPIFLVMFSAGSISRIAMATFGASLVIAANTSFAFSHIGPLRSQVVRVYGGNWVDRFAVVCRQALPQSLDGARVALNLSLILTIVGEIMLGAADGLGTRVNDSFASFNLIEMYANVLVVGLIGWILSVVSERIVTKLAWYGRHL